MRTILSAGANVFGGENYAEPVRLDISGEDPQGILTSSTLSFQHGIPDFLEDKYNLYPKLVLSDASIINKMVETLRNGKMFLPTGGESSDDKILVDTVYTHLLNHFD
ncbi:MAG: hypothetical protein K2X28_06300 [Alphaproteobacteria bacterium]|nr:hypothetical protein [Alphaproteobacteria bacterium]